MKRIFILLTLMACMTGIHAQEDFDYRPFIEEGKVWVSKPEIFFNQAGIHTPRYVVEYDYFEGDTVVAGRQCKKWIQDYRSPEGEKLLSRFVTMYEEDKKVWFFFKGETEPMLAYDFGAQVGDTVAVVQPCAYYYEDFKEHGLIEEYMERSSDSIIILSKTEEELLGKRRTVTYFSSMNRLNGSSKSDRYLEYNYYMYGIGTHYCPNYNTGVNSGNGSSWLMYCIVGDETLYADEEKAQFWGIARPSAVTVPSSIQPNSHPQLFDLTGRRLSARPTKGLYIEDGKVRVGGKK